MGLHKRYQTLTRSSLRSQTTITMVSNIVPYLCGEEGAEREREENAERLHFVDFELIVAEKL